MQALADGVAGAALALSESPAARRAPERAQFASAGRVPPVDLPVREDLRTRLGWGPVHAVQPLAEADTREALRQEAGRRGVVLGRRTSSTYILVRFRPRPERA